MDSKTRPDLIHRDESVMEISHLCSTSVHQIPPSPAPSQNPKEAATFSQVHYVYPWYEPAIKISTEPARSSDVGHDQLPKQRKTPSIYHGRHVTLVQFKTRGGPPWLSVEGQ
jgi:hypothetical protein